MSASPEEQEQIRQQIPDIEIVEAQELTRYQKTVKRNLLTALSRLKDEQNRLAEEIRSIAAKDIYAEDYFKKTFDSLLTQTASPKNLAEQYAVNKASYESQLEKLKIDLASIDNEQKNIEEMFLEYVRSVNANIAMIDKNSTISVRGRNIKMLKIQVADWQLDFFILPLLLYCFGLVADIMAFWISTGGSVFSTGNHIWYPVAPNSPSDVKWCGLYGIPAVIFMAGYLIRLAIRKRVACHVSEPNDPLENIIR